MSNATTAKAIGLPSDGRAAIADKLSLRRERCLSCFRNCENMRSAGVSNSERRSAERHRAANAAQVSANGACLKPVGNDNSRAAFGNHPRHPPGRRRRGYARARFELCRLLNDRWRVYYKDELLLETAHPTAQAPVDFIDTRDPAGPRACVKSEIGQSFI
jgi:hypothetical protein